MGKGEGVVVEADMGFKDGLAKAKSSDTGMTPPWSSKREQLKA